MEMLLAGDDDALAILRQQLIAAEVTSREMTGVGFYTNFSIPLNAARIPNQPSFKLGDVNGKAKNVEHGLGFILFVTDGAIKILEGYTYDEPWPEELEDSSFEYSQGPERNIDEVRKRIHLI